MTDANRSGVEPGMVLGTYRVERLLGRGGMGSVFLAYDTRLHRHVALKIIDADAGDPTTSARLLREARNAAALSHPNICAIHEVGEAAGKTFIAMEFVGGRSLRERIDQGTLPANEAVRLGIQAADALAYAHERGVTHRDFKAANAIVTDTGRLKVIDFGLARRDDARTTEGTTLASIVPVGTVAGTPYAMAPEQVRAEAADARTDVWALGVLLHEMVSGAKPFAGQTVPDLYSSILTKPPAALPATVATGLRAVIDRCLEKDPARRYQRAGEVRAALEAFEAGKVSPWITIGYQLRRRPMLASSVAVAVVVATLGVLNIGGLRDRFMGRPTGGPPIKLAVLPFQNLTGDPDQEYFSDGLTDEMITQLGRLHPRRLSVTARTSSMRYKKRDLPIDQIARELGVDYVMEGSARRDGNRVRISATLIQVRDQTQLLSESFERELANILSLQSDVASGVARALSIALLPSEQARLAAARVVNPEAYEAYLKGRFTWQSMQGPKGLEAAMRYFELAAQKDPGYAAPHAGMGTLWGLRCTNGATPCPEAWTRWKEATLKARQLDPDSIEAHANIAAIAYYVDWDWPAADREFRRAIDLDASFPDTYMWYAGYLINVANRPDEAIAAARRASELDPQNSLYLAIVAKTLLQARRDAEGIAMLQEILARDPSSQMARVNLTWAFARRKMYDEAFAMMQKTAANNPAAAERQRQAHADGGFLQVARLRPDTMAQQAARTYVAPGAIAAAYARAEVKDLALDWLEKSFDSREPMLVDIKTDPSWDFVRRQPRFEAILRKMKLQ